jgi:hypothetical protein
MNFSCARDSGGRALVLDPELHKKAKNRRCTERPQAIPITSGASRFF